MKTLLKFSLIFLSFFLLLVMSSYCQFVPIALTNFWGETDNNQKIEAIGIGDYSNTNVQPNAALDITIPYLFVNSPPLIYPGEAIRSTAEADYNHTWKMFTYPDKEKFHVMNPKTTPDIDLNVLQRGNLNFFTDNTQWMRLNAQGNLGLSDEWSTFTGPTEQLHQHKDRSASVWHHFTNGNTGFNSSQGFRTGLFFNPTFNWSEAHFEQWHYAPIITMLANSSGAYKERIKVWQGLGGDQVGGWANTPDITKISINHGLGNSGAVDYSPMPVCMLNIGRRGASGTQAGNRAWMDVGTYYNFDSDNMYVGLKDDGPNRKDAVINWGDDANAAPDQDFENLLFIFTNTNYNPGSIDSYDYNSKNGLTVARMNAKGQMGIGAGFSSTLTPKRKLDIFDDGINRSTYPSGPQLRLSAALNANPALGTWSDFQTTTNGDLEIFVKKANSFGRVGINKTLPTNTLEINANVSSNFPGASGLSFTNYTTASYVGTNQFSGNKGVLSVDANGKVILVKDETVSPGSGLNVCTPGGIGRNYLLRMSDPATNTVCTSDVYDDYLNGKVGVGISPFPQRKLDVGGDLGITAPLYYSNTRMLASDGAGIPSFGSNLYLGMNAGNTTLANNDYGNTAIGTYSMTALSSNSSSNTALGYQSARRITSGYSNISIGLRAAINNQTGYENIVIGNDAASDGSNGSGTTIGNQNVILGNKSGLHNISNKNIFIGYQNGSAHINGDQNIYIGNNADIDQYQTTNTFTNVILIGASSSVKTVAPATTINNATAIGERALVSCSDCISLGNNVTRTLMGFENVPPLTGASIGDYRLYVNNVPTPGGTGRAAYFNGDIYFTGAYLPSDSIIKNQIANIDTASARNILNRITPKSYYYDTLNYSRLNLPKGLQYGIIAEELERVLPNLVKNQKLPADFDSIGHLAHPEIEFKSINYTGLIPLLLAGLKSQEAKINELENRINRCCGSPANNSTEKHSIINLELNSENAIVLNQNDPNPFAEQTIISYNIPTDIKDAVIMFYDHSGRVIQSVKINERGQGQINVYAENLSSGTYSYSLIIDGKVADTKRMVCLKQ